VQTAEHRPKFDDVSADDAAFILASAAADSVFSRSRYVSASLEFSLFVYLKLRYRNQNQKQN